MGGMCAATCSMGFAHCSMNPLDGCEVNTQTDPKSCGACGMACNMLPNATSVCTGGVCSVGACVMGFAHCTMNPKDGCETDMRGDAANCGGCGKTCPAVANGVPGCKASKCGVGSCNMGFADCDAVPANGCETTTGSDPLNCGACSHLCKGNFSVQGCMAGACIIMSCTQGFA